jgi:hypothetical protein
MKQPIEQRPHGVGCRLNLYGDVCDIRHWLT